MKKRWIVLMMVLALVLLIPTALAESAGEAQNTAVPVEKINIASVMKDVPAMKQGIKVDETYNIAVWVSVQPSGASKDQLVYQSSDESIAVVQAGGDVVGKAPGNVTITILDPVGGKSAKINLKIIRPVSKITLSPDGSQQLFTGKKLKINATVFPENASNKKVEWESEDPNIAKVSNGTITGVNPGITHIYCRATDGGHAINSVMVTVSRPLKKITFASKSSTVIEGEDIYPTYNTEPVDATNKDVDWTSSDEYVATVGLTGRVHGKKPGKTTITAVARDGSGVKASITVYVEPKDTLDVDYLWWETNRYGIKTGRIKVDVVSKCINRRIKGINLSVYCYDSAGNLTGTTFPAAVINAKPGKRVTTKWLYPSINGLNNATKKMEVKVEAITYDDGTMFVYPYGEQKTTTFELR